MYGEIHELSGMAEKNRLSADYVFRLFITGATPNSLKAVVNFKKFCGAYLEGRYFLEVIDVYQQPAIAQEEQLVALPLLVCKKPLPERRFIGDLSDTNKILKGLGLQPHGQ